jgi:hypothetical protein
MTITGMKRAKRALRLIAVLGLAGVSLAGCVYYPSGYAYGPGYYAPAYVAPAPVYGGVWFGGWHGGGGHWH